MTVHVHPDAYAEMLAALDHYAEIDRQEGGQLAADLRDAFRDALGAISEAPRRYPPYLLGSRRYLMRRFPYALIFDVEPQVVVLAVAHAKRRPGYWQTRRT